MSVIFLAGVHGVGKGFLGIPVARRLGIDHFTASQLIREERGQISWDEDKRTAEVEINQLALIRAVNQKRESGKDILLDGHFVLRAINGGRTRVPSNVFAQLRLVGAVVLKEDANIISRRLAARDGAVADVNEIEDLAAEELLHAEIVCQQLHVPLAIINSPNEASLVGAITKFLSR